MAYHIKINKGTENRETQFGRDYDLSRDRLILELELILGKENYMIKYFIDY
jgi:hypothetical protein